MPPTSIQDRTSEFRAILADVTKRQLNQKARAQRQHFSASREDVAHGGIRQRSAFAQQAAVISKGIVSAPASALPTQ